ncbi:MAG: hypothetical protein ABSE43_16315, partial [Steroidobacteraceae bacterium]
STSRASPGNFHTVRAAGLDGCTSAGAVLIGSPAERPVSISRPSVDTRCGTYALAASSVGARLAAVDAV